VVLARDAQATTLSSSIDWRRQFELVRLSANRQLRARYRGSAFGVLWSFVNPVLMTAIYASIFGTAFASYYGGSTARYVVSAFVAVAVVTYILQATSESLTAVVTSGGLLNKIAIDPETFPVAAVAANTFQQGVTTFPVILLVSVVVAHDPLRAVLVPCVLAGVVLLTLGISLALSALYVFFRDLSYLWGIVGFVLWLSSPVFYPAALVAPTVRKFLVVNPVGMAIGAMREVAIGSGPIDFVGVLRFLIVAVVVAALGHALFRRLRPEFMDML
jgi:ABC-type polysaccharide/polyol phosphate export permease